jgi:hypothetical protein
MRTNTDATLYNRKFVDGVETYIRSPIHGVAWGHKKGFEVVTEGFTPTQKMSVRIPIDSLVGTEAAPKTYIRPDLYGTVSSDLFYTLAPGDWIVKGLTDAECSVATKNNPDACSIQEVADNTDQRFDRLMWHRRVIG